MNKDLREGEYQLVMHQLGESIINQHGRTIHHWTDDGYGDNCGGTLADCREAARALWETSAFADAEFGAFDGCEVTVFTKPPQQPAGPTYSADGHELHVGDQVFVIVSEFPVVKVKVKTIGELFQSGRKIAYTETEDGMLGCRIHQRVFKDGDACNRRVAELTSER